MRKKTLKSYIHFYLGAECLYDQLGKVDKKGRVTCALIKFTQNPSLIGGPKNVRLLLTPLSSLSEKERKLLHLPKLLGYRVWFSPEKFRSLTRKGVDVFNLIEAGIALDKTKL
jgi:hypothetical protein